MKRKVRIYSGRREPARFPSSDAELLKSLMTQVTKALSRGQPRPAILLLSEEQVTQYDLPGLLGSGRSLQHPLLAAIAGQDKVECMALVGVLRMQKGKRKPPLRTTTVYIEWPDNRWAMCWQLLDGSGGPLGDEPVVRYASEGWPRPNGLGGWFARARREQLRLRVQSSNLDVNVH